MKIIKVKTTGLRAQVPTDGVSLPVYEFVDSNGDALSLGDFGTFFVVVVKQANTTEIMRCDGITQNADGTADLGIATGYRNILPKPPYSSTTTGKAFNTGAEVIVTNDPYTMSQMLQINDADTQTVVGSILFPTPTLDAQAATKGYADGIAAAGAADASTTGKGISRLSVSPNITLGVCTMTIATPAVISYTAHGLTENDTIQFTTTGALPTGLAVSTNYFVISTGLTANDFQISATLGGAAIDTSGIQSGVHTLIKTTPIAVSENDTRLPTQDEKDAMAGISNLPDTGNPFATEDDIRDPAVFLTPVVRVYEAGATWTKPANLKYIEVEVQAGGAPGGQGGSNSNGYSGGAGGYSRKLIPAASLSATETVTVGAIEGDSSFGTHATTTAASGITGGTAASGDINIPGQSGHPGLGHDNSGSSSEYRPPAETPSIFGAAGYGSGGRGESQTSGNEGAGVAGVVIVTEHYI